MRALVPIEKPGAQLRHVIEQRDMLRSGVLKGALRLIRVVQPAVVVYDEVSRRMVVDEWPGNESKEISTFAQQAGQLAHAEAASVIEAGRKGGVRPRPQDGVELQPVGVLDGEGRIRLLVASLLQSVQIQNLTTKLLRTHLPDVGIVLRV